MEAAPARRRVKPPKPAPIEVPEEQAPFELCAPSLAPTCCRALRPCLTPRGCARSLDGTFREKDFEISRAGVRFGVHGMARSASGGDLAILGDTDLWLPATATARPSESRAAAGCGVRARAPHARAQVSLRAALTQRAWAGLHRLLTPPLHAPQQPLA